MSDDTQNSEKKLYVDEDWKSQVEAEKEAAEHAKETSQPAKSAEESHVPLPPADLVFLIRTFHLQAAMAMGLLPNPVTKKAEIQLDHAKHSIDMLAMIQQKTEGNRTPEESEMLEAILNELRWAFISIGEQLKAK
jgi:hypothetical protein